MAASEGRGDPPGGRAESISEPGAVQPFGFLIALAADWRIEYVSDNVEHFLGQAPDALIESDLSAVIDGDALHDIRNGAFQLDEPDAVGRLFGLALRRDRPDLRFDCAVHRSGDLILLEAEPSEPAEPAEAAGMIKAMIGRVESAGDRAAFLRQGAQQVQALTGFDRVMVYGFQRDGSAEVVAEVARSGSLIGLRLPAGDFPPQARALYLRMPFRIICNVDAVPAAIRPAAARRDVPLDLSLSILRAVPPSHIAYLRRLGVGAAVTIAIVVEGRLWGLFACHHRSPRCPSFATRTLLELFAQMFSMKLEARERRAAIEFDGAARQICDGMMAAIANDVGLLGDAGWIGRTVAAIMPCDGAVIRMEGRTATIGTTPPRATVRAIAARFHELDSGRIFATDHVAGLGLAEAADDPAIAGVLAIPISSPPGDYLMLFRRPRAHGEGRDRAEPFSDAELRAAETVRASLIDVALRMTAAASAERRRATERQELLIAELNHRVRNILALISGLIARSRDARSSVAEYSDLLEGRVQALSRAHDQITHDNWTAASLTQLLETEGAGAAASGRLMIAGPPVLLEPTAFATVTLVVHELMTNSAKHGALSGDGRVLVDWTCDADGALDLRWREQDGPAVEPPRQYGLGTTIIERSIPHDLGGTARIAYDPAGVEARFTIPAVHVARSGSEPTTPPAGDGQAAPAGHERPAHDVILLVEDSFLIALHVHEMLESLGATEIIMTATVAEAIAELERTRPDFAILDINLGSETSLPVADRLRREAIPFVFATGYGTQWRIPDEHAEVAVVQKPYNRANLAAALGMRASEPPADDGSAHRRR